MVEGLTFLINSSNFADDIVLYCVCGRRVEVTKKMEDGQKGAWSCLAVLALEDFGFGRVEACTCTVALMNGKGYTSRYPESHRSRTTHVISNEILYYQRYLFV